MAQSSLFDKFKVNNAMQIEKPTVEKINPSTIMPWVEKYRPNKIDEISYQEEVVNALNGVLNTGNLPHTLFYGPPGTGKTSTILAMAKQLFGTSFYRQRILELNASDDRGINVVREKVKKFAQVMSVKNPDPTVLCPPYKIIILDEADLMTHDAQSALRRIIEDTSANTRFCIICNYITRIIDPISSRCIKYRFKPIPEIAQLKKLKEICHAENLSFQEDALVKLIELSNGDLRRSINTLQSTCILFEREITFKNIEQISGVIPNEELDYFVAAIYEKSFPIIQKKVQEFIYQGYSSEQLICQFYDFLQNFNISELQKARMIEKIAKCEQCIVEGSNDYLQILNLFTSILYIMEYKD